MSTAKGVVGAGASGGAPAPPPGNHGDSHYDELTRTNNELANLQRELAARNAALAATEAAQRQQQTELRALFDLMPAMLWVKDADNHILRVNQRVADHAGKRIDEIEGRPSAEIYPKDAARFYADDLEVIRSGVPKLAYVENLSGPDGADLWVQTDKVPYAGADGKFIGVVVMAQDITARKQVEAALAKANLELLDKSRLAGMAEVAAEVLHNVGNVLNSVNVSAGLAADLVRNSRAGGLAQVVALLHEHAQDLGSYITTDPKGRHIPDYIAQASADWLAQEQALSAEMQALQTHVNHIREIVAKQQRHGRMSGATEMISVADVLDECVRMVDDALGPPPAQVFREYAQVPPIRADKHRLKQILLTLLSNANQACRAVGVLDPRISLRVLQAGARLGISVGDNGAGIAAENLVRIFAHGYRKPGGGIADALHQAALTASGLGGSLSADSAGPGKGATFTLQLPLSPPAARA